MPQPMQTKSGGKGDGEDPKRVIAESEPQHQDLSTAGHLRRMIEQDRLDGVHDDHLHFLKSDESEKESDHDDRDAGLAPDIEGAEDQQSSQFTKGDNNADPTYDQQVFDAVEKGASGKLDKLLSRGMRSPDCRDSQGRTPLMLAAEDGNAALVGVLLRHGADIDVVDADGETALVKTAYGGHLDVAELLVSKAAALDLRNNEGLSALEIAQEMEHEAVAAFLSAQSQESTSSIEPTSTDTDREFTADSVSEVAKCSDIEPHQEPEEKGEYREETAAGPAPETEPHSAAVEATGKTRTKILGSHGAVLEKKTGTRPTLQPRALSANEKRIDFDALDNSQVRSINEKVIKVLDKAGFEVGDYVIDTVFRGSHNEVFKLRSQGNKRWRKLKQHPDWVIDPKRLTEFTGGCAARRLCLAEGKDISHFTMSHFIELYYAKDPKLILTLVEEASTNKYTVRQLKRAVEELREHKDDHDPGKEIIKTLDQEVPILEDPDLMALCTDKDRVLEELSKAERKKIRALIKSRKPSLDDWKNLMDTLEAILSDLEDE